MKYLTYLFLYFIVFTLFSCSKEDDNYFEPNTSYTNQLQVQNTATLQNGSFENYTQLHYGCGGIQYVNNWFEPAPPMIYYYNELHDPIYGVPQNGLGNQAAKTGKGYIALTVHSSSNYRQYIAQKLAQALEKDSMYYLEFYVSLTDNSQSACNAIGATFFQDSVYQQNSTDIIEANPYIDNNAIIYNTTDWTKIFGVFKADGTENYLYIGNFYKEYEIDQFSGYDATVTYYVDAVNLRKM